MAKDTSKDTASKKKLPTVDLATAEYSAMTEAGLSAQQATKLEAEIQENTKQLEKIYEALSRSQDEVFRQLAVHLRGRYESIVELYYAIPTASLKQIEEELTPYHAFLEGEFKKEFETNSVYDGVGLDDAQKATLKALDQENGGGPKFLLKQILNKCKENLGKRQQFIRKNLDRVGDLFKSVPFVAKLGMFAAGMSTKNVFFGGGLGLILSAFDGDGGKDLSKSAFARKANLSRRQTGAKLQNPSVSSPAGASAAATGDGTEVPPTSPTGTPPPGSPAGIAAAGGFASESLIEGLSKLFQITQRSTAIASRSLNVLLSLEKLTQQTNEILETHLQKLNFSIEESALESKKTSTEKKETEKTPRPTPTPSSEKPTKESSDEEGTSMLEWFGISKTFEVAAGFFSRFAPFLPGIARLFTGIYGLYTAATKTYESYQQFQEGKTGEATTSAYKATVATGTTLAGAGATLAGVSTLPILATGGALYYVPEAAEEYGNLNVKELQRQKEFEKEGQTYYPAITPFAKGGVVTQPTNALIGEAGPEAVIPLNQLNRLTGDSEVILRDILITMTKTNEILLSQSEAEKYRLKEQKVSAPTAVAAKKDPAEELNAADLLEDSLFGKILEPFSTFFNWMSGGQATKVPTGPPAGQPQQTPGGGGTGTPRAKITNTTNAIPEENTVTKQESYFSRLGGAIKTVLGQEEDLPLPQAPTVQRETAENLSAFDESGAIQLQEIKTSVLGLKTKVNAAYAERFQKFIDELEQTGYVIKDLGGYSHRANANDPSKASYHAYGASIDINPSANPNMSRTTDLPVNVREIAQKYGIAWGMDFKKTPDPMHFSIAKLEGGMANIPRQPLSSLRVQQAPATQMARNVPPTTPRMSGDVQAEGRTVITADMKAKNRTPTPSAPVVVNNVNNTNTVTGGWGSAPMPPIGPVGKPDEPAIYRALGWQSR